MEIAKTYPTIERLVGVDISSKMMEYARAQAESMALDGRVQFQTMDALRILEFPTASFDLVNQRLGQLATHLGVEQSSSWSTNG